MNPSSNQDAATKTRSPNTATRPSYLLFDLSGIYIAWELNRKAWEIYGLISLIADHEAYTVDKYTLLGDDTTQRNFSTTDRNNAELRFNFGIGTRIYFARFFSFWLEKRWIVGERFSANRTFGAGGLF